MMAANVSEVVRRVSSNMQEMAFEIESKAIE